MRLCWDWLQYYVCELYVFQMNWYRLAQSNPYLCMYPLEWSEKYFIWLRWTVQNSHADCCCYIVTTLYSKSLLCWSAALSLTSWTAPCTKYWRVIYSLNSFSFHWLIFSWTPTNNKAENVHQRVNWLIKTILILRRTCWCWLSWC